jgi:SsrA-binding protein
MSPKPKINPKTGAPSRTIAVNRKAYHEYHVLETFETGIVLTGTEITSIRAGKISSAESFARIQGEEVFLYASQISPYDQGNIHNHVQDRVRKLLLKREEIKKLIGKTKEKGLTLIPLKFYYKRAWVKVELGLCKGKLLHDKRETLKARESKREMDRAIKGTH